jgi:surfactin synthase thioesterase subunit
MSDSEWGRGIIGGESRLFPSPPPMQVDIVKPSAVKNTMHTAAAVLGLGLAGYCAMKVRQAHQRRARQPHRLKLMAGGRPMAIPTADASDDEERATTKLHIEVSATDRCALKISMGSISTMEDLQELVAEVRDVAGYVDGHLIAPHGH